MNKVANKRLSNRVIWSLEDILAEVYGADQHLERAINRVESRYPDPALKIILQKLKVSLTEIKALAIAARHGQYAGRHRAIDLDEN